MPSLQEHINALEHYLDKSRPLGLLALRLILAYGFLAAARNHWSDMEGTIAFFDAVGIPFASINAYIATFTEFIGVFLLTLGLATRYISIPLIFTMIVAIITVHWGNGYEAFKNIPQNSFLFNGDAPLGSSSGVDIYHAGEKIGSVEVYATGGMEIPVMYLAMLLVLLAFGSGTLSLDRLFRR